MLLISFDSVAARTSPGSCSARPCDVRSQLVRRRAGHQPERLPLVPRDADQDGGRSSGSAAGQRGSWRLPGEAERNQEGRIRSHFQFPG